MRRNAWISNAITQEIDQPKYLRTVRENARNILTRQGALGALEAAGIVSGSPVLFTDFANGQDDAELLESIRGPERLSFVMRGWWNLAVRTSCSSCVYVGVGAI